MKISELKEGTWFTQDASETKNSYKLIGECGPGTYAAKCGNVLVEFCSGTMVSKIDGFKLYLLQGGRDWD